MPQARPLFGGGPMQEPGYYQFLVEKLSRIGIEMSAQRDVDALLVMILRASMDIVTADAGSIYILEQRGDATLLAFKYTENHTVDYPYQSFAMPLDKNSIAGAAAVTGQTYNFKSMDETLDRLGFKHNRSYDEAAGYHTVNMLTIPLKNYHDEVIGVLQLINKKSHREPLKDQRAYSGIVPFTREDEGIIEALASQAAILIERNQLFGEIQQTLESTIKVLVTALDQRDPITAGHSDRVAQYALDLGRYLQQLTDGVHPEYLLDQDHLSELYIAGLLHDVGKIGVPEYLLMKANKLTDAQVDAISSRFKLVALALETERGAFIENPIPDFVKQRQDLMSLIEKINKSGFLPDADGQVLKALEASKFSLGSESFKLLEAQEYEQLSIPRGNLTEGERQLINDHVRMSHALLENVKWSRTLKEVPAIASQHHEKLNGKGYPYGLAGPQIGLRGRLMAIADIFDALTAKDRPYKPAMPVAKAISILREEAQRGALDEKLVAYFVAMIEGRDGQSYDN